MEIFAVGETKMQLFRDPVEQQVVLWRGKNLVIHAKAEAAWVGKERARHQ